MKWAQSATAKRGASLTQSSRGLGVAPLREEGLYSHQDMRAGWSAVWPTQEKSPDGSEDMHGAAGEGGVEVPHGDHGALVAEEGSGGGGDVTTVLPTIPIDKPRIFFFKS
jgi:hypothetical protein